MLAEVPEEDEKVVRFRSEAYFAQRLDSEKG
jgi:hypothetical protein